MTYLFPIEEGEFWWGGSTGAAVCPLARDSAYRENFLDECSNQTMPLYVSSKGRCIWSENPFAVEIVDGAFVMEGADIELVQAGETLRDAYLSAMRAHFPCDRRALPDEFFRTAQYNTWMEFTYRPTQEGVLAFARGYVAHGYRPGIFIIDEGWHGRYGDWRFDEARFPDPRKMVDELHEMGFTVLLWVVPYVCPDGEKFIRSIRPDIGGKKEAEKGLYLRTRTGEVALLKWWNGYSAALNLANPIDAEFLDEQLQALMRDCGVDGFKFDGGTPHGYTNANVMDGELDTALTPHELNIAWNRFGSRYPFHEYKDTWKGGGHNTIQRLRDKNHCWRGGVDQLIPCALNCGLIGHPFICPDMVGGGEWSFKANPNCRADEELFVRMAQCSALFPMIQFSWAPWEALSAENARLCAEAAALHADMAAEILALVREAEQTGEPILRSLEYNDPHQGFAPITDEFMLGENLLVAPVLEKGARQRRVAFPKGRWMDANGREYEGRQTRTLPAPLNTLLWFRRV